MDISFHGAAGQVTGSCHLVTCAGMRILVDCGLFQGGRELHEENAKPFGFEPSTIDVVILTHAHLDHCGRIPLLVRQGFDGEIIATAATRELARLVLLDSAHLQEEEARRRQRKRRHHKQRSDTNGPLYDTLDVLNSFDRFGRPARYGARIELRKGIAVTFFDAGHILGSASVLVELTEGGRRRCVLFSGDIGGGDNPLLGPPDPPADADVVVMETTYGDRDHRSRAASVAEFYEAIRDARSRGGNVVIPTFALERTQDLLFHLHEGVATGALPADMEVFLDSPMAISATEIFRRHPECYNPRVTRLFRSGEDPFSLPRLHFIRETSESMALNRIRSGAVIMAGSGMCTGGRIRHHLRHNLAHPDCSVIFVGFAAHGTLAREIVDGAGSVRIFGDDIPVKARIHTINGFSAHADRSELLSWLGRTGRPEMVFLVHGEDSQRGRFAEGIAGRTVVIPEAHSSYAL